MSLTIARSASWARPISTTTPFASSASARMAASITKVAPCSAWAGPNISPRNEWAIITWSRTSTANIGPSGFRRIRDELAKHAAVGRENLWQARRQVGECDGRREQRIEPRIGKEVERGREPAAMRPARTVRGRDLADLAGDEPEPPAVEGAAERCRHVAGAIPAHLQDGRLLARKRERGREPGRAAARMHDEVAVAWRRVRGRKSAAERLSEPGALAHDVDQCDLRAGQAAAQPCHQSADHPAAHHRDAVGR